MMSRDDGISVVELLIAMSLMLVAAAVFGTALSTSFTVTKDFQGAAGSNDNVRLVLKQINRELRSAEVIHEPLPGGCSNTLDFDTRAYAGTAKVTQHIIYQVSSGTLQRSADGGTTWREVITNVVNAGNEPLFTTQGGSLDDPSEGKVVTISIWTDADPTDRIPKRLARTETSGRNIWTPNQGGTGSCP